MLGYPEIRPRWPETELECFAAKRRTGEMAPVVNFRTRLLSGVVARRGIAGISWNLQNFEIHPKYPRLKPLAQLTETDIRSQRC